MERRTVMEYTVSFIWISIEVFCLYFTCKAFLLPRFNSTQNSVFFSVSVALFFVAKNLIDRTVLAGSIISIVIALFLCLLFSGIAFSGSWYIHVVIAVVYYFSLAAVDTAIVYSMSLLLGITVNDLIWKKWLYSVVVASGKLILLFGSWLLSVIYGKKKTQPISKTKIAIYSVFPFLSILMMYTIRYKVNDLSMLNLEANAIVVVLSNLLDNAIEGTMRLPADHRTIECATLLDENFFVSIRNTAPQVEIKDDPCIPAIRFSYYFFK